MATIKIEAPFDNNTGMFTVSGNNNRYVLSKDDVIISFGYGISEVAGTSGNTIDIMGVVNAFTAINIRGIGTTINVGSTGQVLGVDGIDAADGTHLVNRGAIDAESEGVLFGSNTRIDNYGSITAPTAIHAGPGVFVNHAGGLISADNIAIDISGAGTSTVLNHGVIRSSRWAFMDDGSDTTITNRGTILGSVSLAAGDDVFDTRGGRFNGTLIGGLGDDVLITSSPIRFDEAADQGFDTVKSTATYSLWNHLDQLILLGKKAIDGTGNGLDNVLKGNSAANNLTGLAGLDRIDGGKGSDVMTGGADDDVFVFATGYGRDAITDFETGVDKIDLTNLKAIVDFTDLIDNHTRQTADGLLIFAGKDRLLIEGITSDGLAETDLVFL